MVFKDGGLCHALGKEGATCKRLETAAGAVCQHAGHVASIRGESQGRTRCSEFITWLLPQRRGVSLKRMRTSPLPIRRQRLA
mmetsp:Transcript_125711/g.391467  ORF Transcript_125711/g.391467 Transcript_125711/m.391467 type:complete len:82 (+) Transcript_125711:269-514(+)